MEIRRGMFRGLVEKGRSRFGDEAWWTWVQRFRERPNDFAMKALGSRWWSAQEDVGRAVARSKRVVVRSANGVGKTYLAADLALWFLHTHRPSVVITSAPTSRQVRHLLWHEIRRRYATSRGRLPGKLLKTRVDLWDDSFAIGVAAEGGVQFQGFHCENLLIILDEASGIADEIWDAAEGIAVGSNNRILAIGNPLQATGRFYQNFTRGGWKRITISALQHPNVTGRGRTIPGCVSREFVAEKVEEWCEPGEGAGLRVDGCAGDRTQAPTWDEFRWEGRFYVPNDLFRARVLGEFPKSESSALIPLRWVEAAVARSLPAEGARRAAVDVARFGDDCTVIGLRVGSVLTKLEVIRGADTMQVSGAITRLAYSEHPSRIAIDAIGLGAGIVDRLREQRIEGILPVNSAGTAYDSELFANRRAELYWGLRERFRLGDIQIPGDAALVEELAGIRYQLNSRGQIQIEKKEEIKRRLRRSPDRADMLAMVFDGTGDWAAVIERPTLLPPSPSAALREEMRGW